MLAVSSKTRVAGFEPAHKEVKVPCLTTWLYPINSDTNFIATWPGVQLVSYFCVGWCPCTVEMLRGLNLAGFKTVALLYFNPHVFGHMNFISVREEQIEYVFYYNECDSLAKGRCGIRTHAPWSDLTVFETVLFSRAWVIFQDVMINNCQLTNTFIFAWLITSNNWRLVLS